MTGTRIVPFSPEDHATQLSYSLPEKQQYFVDEPHRYFSSIAKVGSCPDRYCLVLVVNKQPAGFVVLDGGPDRLRYTDEPESLLIRGLSINPKYQRQGLGRAFMKLLPSYVKDYLRHRGVKQLVLGVNVANVAAYKLYAACGYLVADYQVTGAHGSQHVMYYPLDEDHDSLKQ